MSAAEGALDDASSVLIALSDGVAEVTLNRPAQLNALTPEMLGALGDALGEVEASPDVAVVVLKGAGRDFCAGGDVTAMSETARAAADPIRRPLLEEAQRTGHFNIAYRLHTMAKPTIAVVSGPVAGAGFSLALACDLRYAGESTTFRTAFSRMALPGDYGISWLLAHAVGPARAKELLLFSERVDARQAAQYGLVNSVFSDVDLHHRALERAARLAAGPASAYRAIKANVNFALDASFDQSLEREVGTHIAAKSSPDHLAAIAAFVEGRQPGK